MIHSTGKRGHMIGRFRVKSKGSVEQRRDDNESPDTVDVVKRDKLVLQTSPYKLHYSSSSVRNAACNITLCASQFIITWSYFSQGQHLSISFSILSNQSFSLYGLKLPPFGTITSLT